MQRGARRGDGHRHPEHEQLEQGVESVTSPRRPEQRREFSLAEMGERVDAEPFRQRVEAEPGLVETLPRAPNIVRPVEETHAAGSVSQVQRESARPRRASNASCRPASADTATASAHTPGR